MSTFFVHFLEKALRQYFSWLIKFIPTFKDFGNFYTAESFVMRCTIWYHLCNLKNVKNTHGGVLLLVKLQTKRLKVF